MKTAHEIWAAVKANHAVLDACPRHHFEGDPAEVLGKAKDGVVFRRFRCAKCGGTVDSHARYWYEMGLQHRECGS